MCIVMPAAAAAVYPCFPAPPAQKHAHQLPLLLQGIDGLRGGVQSTDPWRAALAAQGLPLSRVAGDVQQQLAAQLGPLLAVQQQPHLGTQQQPVDQAAAAQVASQLTGPPHMQQRLLSLNHWLAGGQPPSQQPRQGQASHGAIAQEAPPQQQPAGTLEQMAALLTSFLVAVRCAVRFVVLLARLYGAARCWTAFNFLWQAPQTWPAPAAAAGGFRRRGARRVSERAHPQRGTRLGRSCALPAGARAVDGAAPSGCAANRAVNSCHAASCRAPG